MNWDDIQVALAVARAGTTAGAAAHLGVSHSTVIRRITAFETAHNVTLFDRSPTGYQVTSAGKTMLEHAEKIETSVMTIERSIVANDLKLSGKVHVTTTDTVLNSVFMEFIAAFRQTHPDISLTLSVTNTRLDITRNSAEIAIRPSQKPPEHLIGRKVSALDFAIYGARQTYARRKTLNADELTDEPWLGVDLELLNAPVANWMDKEISEHRIVMRANSFLTLRNAVTAKLGVCVLPCSLGDTERELIRLSQPIPELRTHLWLLTHPDLKDTARIRALTNHLAKSFKANRNHFEMRGN